MKFMIIIAMFLIACQPKEAAPRPDSTAVVDTTDKTADSATAPKMETLKAAADAKVESISQVTKTYKDDTSKVIVRYSLSGKPRATITIRLARTTPGGLPSVSTTRSHQSDSVEFKTERINGKKATYWSCAYYKANTKCISWDTNWPFNVAGDTIFTDLVQRSWPADAKSFTKRDSTSPTTDSNSVRICVFGVTTNGRRVKLKNSWNIPKCEELFQSWLKERPS